MNTTNWTATPSSSNVAGHGYDPETQTVTVEFKGGAAYTYAAVPGEVYAALAVAPSAGSFIAANLRNTYTASRIAKS